MRLKYDVTLVRRDPETGQVQARVKHCIRAASPAEAGRRGLSAHPDKTVEDVALVRAAMGSG